MSSSSMTLARAKRPAFEAARAKSSNMGRTLTADSTERGWSPRAGADLADPPTALHSFGGSSSSGWPGLTIGRPDDAYEAEAERAADAVVASDGEAVPAVNSAAVRGAPRVQARAAGGARPQVTAELPRQMQAATTEARAMPAEQRAFYEGRLGHDFSAVRIHAGPAAAAAASSVQAQAFTLGNDVYFGQSFYQPHAPAGQRLIAHELAHTVQQRPNVIARRALDDAPAAADAGPASAEATSASRELAETLPGGEDLASERVSQLDPEARGEALARLRDQLPAGETDKAEALARREAERPDAKTPPPKPAPTPAKPGETPSPGAETLGVETRAEPAAPAPVETKPAEVEGAPAPAHERASAGAAAKMQEAVQAISGEPATGDVDSELAAPPETPAAAGGEKQAQGGDAAAAAQSAVALLGAKLAELQEVKSLPVLFAEESGAGDSDAARRRESMTVAQSFTQRMGAKVEQLLAVGLAAPGQAMASLDAAQATLTGQVAAQGASVHDAADKARKRVDSQANQVRSAIGARQAGADSAEAAGVKAARERAVKAHDKASGDIEKRAGTEKTTIAKSYADAEAPMAAVGDTAAGNAVAAAAEWKSKLPPYEKDWSWLDGPVENDRIDAKKEAVDKVAAEYGKSFRQSAKDQAAKTPEKKPEVLAKVDEITRQAGSGLTRQLDQVQQGATAHEKGAKAQSRQVAGKMKAALESSAAQNASALEAAEKEHGVAVSTRGAEAAAALDNIVGAGVSGLADGVSQTAGELIGSIRSFVDSAAKMPVPPPDELADALGESGSSAEGSLGALSEQVAAAAPSLAQTLGAVGEQGDGALQATAAAARQGFEGVATNFAASAASVRQQAATGFAALSKSHSKGAADIGGNAEAGFQEAAANAEAAYKGFGDSVQDNFRVGREQMLAGLWSKEAQSKLNGDMKTYADEAASHVQPRWKKVLKWVVTIVVIVAVIAITIASAGALGPVGIILLGAALGAAAGAVQTIAENLIDDGKVNWKQVGKAAIVGAIAGAVGGAGGAVLKGVGSVALKFALETGINVAGGVAGEAVGSLAVGQSTDWIATIKSAGWGAVIGIAISGALHLKGRIKIGGLGEVAAPPPRPTVEPPPPPPRGKVGAFLENAKILAPRPGAPTPEVSVGAGAGGETAPPAPSPAAEPVAAQPSAAPKPTAPPKSQPQPRRAIGFGQEGKVITPKSAPPPGMELQVGGFGREGGLVPAKPAPPPGMEVQVGGFGREGGLVPAKPAPPPGMEVQVGGFGREGGLVPAKPAPGPQTPAAGPTQGMRPSPSRATLHEPGTPRLGGAGQAKPIQAGGRSTFEPRASAETGGDKGPGGELVVNEPTKPLETKPSETPGKAAPAKSKPSAKAEEAGPPAEAKEAGPPAKAEEAGPPAKAEEAGTPAKAEEARPSAKAAEAAPPTKTQEAGPPAKPLESSAQAEPVAGEPAQPKPRATSEAEAAADQGARADLRRQLEIKNAKARKAGKPEPYPDLEAAVEERFKGWKLVEKRGYPNGFDDEASFKKFKDTIVTQLKKFGVPVKEVGVHGSAVSKANPKDIDVAILVEKSEFDALVADARIFKPGSLERIDAAAGKGFLPSYFKPPPPGAVQTLPQAVYGAAGEIKMQISFILKGGGFDIGPYLKF
jgi:hypothetical protein